MLIPIAIAAPIVSLGIAIAKEPEAQKSLEYIFTGIHRGDGKVDTNRLMMTYAPIAMGILVHKGANMIGLNRAMSNAKIPLIRF